MCELRLLKKISLDALQTIQKLVKEKTNKIRNKKKKMALTNATCNTCTTQKSILILDSQMTHTLYVLNYYYSFCCFCKDIKMLTTSFTYSAVCLNTLFFSTKWIYIVLKYKVQRLWFPLSFWWGGGSGNNRGGHFSLVSLRGSAI